MVPTANAAAAAPSTLDEAALRVGKALYRTGQDISGQSVSARIRGDVADSAAIACANCHLRSGFGGQEGTVLAPPVSADILYEPVKLRFNGIEIRDAAPKRPAYTDATLLAALKTGIDASGKPLAENMPRYELTDIQANGLLTYLKTLSAAPSPGIEDKAVHLGTVVSDGVAPADREAMLFGLQKFVSIKNGQAQLYDANPHDRTARMANSMLGSKEVASKRLTLTLWELHGGSETWPAQLQEHARQQPVFALIGGMVQGPWKPVHDFAEAQGLPTLLPWTDLPAADEGGWYTLYTSKGSYQEGAGIANFLQAEPPAAAGEEWTAWRVPSPEADAAEQGFDETWRALGKSPPIAALLGKSLDSLETQVDRALSPRQPSTLLLWSRGETAAILQAIARHPNRPARVFIAASLVGEALAQVPETTRSWLWVAWPWRLPAQEPLLSAGVGAWMQQPALPTERRYRIASSTFAAAQVFNAALMELRGRYVRDHLMDVIGMMKDIAPPSWPRLSFGPGQRHASKGCYIVQLGAGSSLNLTARSEWLTH